MRDTHDGTTHWLGDDGYPACWREHRVCAEAKVARLEKALSKTVMALRILGAPEDALAPATSLLTNNDK